MIRELEDRARRALAHKDLTWLRNIVPSRYHGEPAVMALMLSAAADGDPSLRELPQFEAALTAVRSSAAAHDLGNRLLRLYHDPAIREKMTRPPEEYWNDPEAAFGDLVSLSVNNPRLFTSGPLDEALSALAELRTFGEMHGVEMPAAPPVEQPIDLAGLDQEIRTLLAKDKLTPAEDARLTRLYEVRTEREDLFEEVECFLPPDDEQIDAAEPEAPAPASAGGPGADPLDQEYRSLIQKDRLTPAEDERLTQLVEAKINHENQEDFE
jgi:hypothetical protein